MAGKRTRHLFWVNKHQKHPGEPARGGQDCGKSEVPAQKAADHLRLVHELETHQVEVEMQNEELRRSRTELETSQERYFDLFNLAPVGYITFNEKGLVVEANLKAAALLGVPPAVLGRRLLTNFILKQDQDIYYLQRRQLVETQAAQDCDLRMVKEDGTVFWAHLATTAARDPGGAAVYRIAVTDISQPKQVEETLLESEKKYRLLFENMEEGFALHEIILDGQGSPVDFRFLAANRAYGRHTGMQADQVIGRTMLEILPHADRKQIAAYGRVAQTGEPLEFEYFSNTFKRHLRVRAFRTRPGRFATLFEDITARKQAELALQESEEKYRVIFNNDIYAICIFDLQDYRLLDINNAYTRLYGYSRGELLGGMTINDISAEAQVSVAASRQAEQEGTIYIPQRRHRKKDGTVFPVEIVGGPYLWKGRQVMFGMAHDISGRIAAEEKLQQSKIQYDDLVANIPLGVYIMHSSPQGAVKFDYVSPRVAEMFGVSVEAFLAAAQVGFTPIHPDDLDAFVKLNQEVFHHPRPFEWEGRATINGQERWLRMQSTPEPLPDGDCLWHGIVADISERKAAEMALRESEERFRSLVENAPAAIHISRNMRTIYGNALLTKMFGVGSTAELEGRPVIEYFAPQSRDKANERALRRSLGLPLESAYEATLERPDGSQLPVYLAGSQVNLADGPAVVTFITDISQRKRAEEALAASEKRWRAVFDHAGVGIALADKEGYLIQTNAALQKMLGYSEVELSTMAFAAYTHPDDAAKDQGLYEKLINHQFDCYQLEKRYIRKNGETFWGSLTVTALQDDEGHFQMSVAMVEDISERMAAAEQLRFQAHLLENAGEAVIAADPQGNFIYWNKSAENVFGWKAGEVLGKAYTSIIADAVLVEQSMQAHKLLQANGTWNGVMQRQRKDGRYIDVQMSTSLVYDEQQKPSFMVGVMRDITDLKRMERELRLSEQKFSAAFQSNAALMVMLDAERRFVDVNETFLKTMGYTREEVLGKTSMGLGLFINPEDSVNGMEMLNEAGSLSNFETKLRTKNGAIIYGIISTSILMIEDKPCMLSVLVDITDMKEMESKLLASEKLAGIGTLAAGVAHELNTPLQMITGYSETAAERIRQDKIEPERLLRNLNNIHQSGLRCARIVSSLLAYARPNGGEMCQADLNRLVEDALLLLEYQLRSWANIAVTTELAENMPMLVCNGGQVSQALVNLLSNAKNAMKSGGAITIRSGFDRLSGSQWLQVADSGPGIPAAVRERIFEPFFTTNPVGEGSGLGLSIVQATMRAHGGEVTVSDAVPHGAVLTLYFPDTPPANSDGQADGGSPAGRYDVK